MKSIEEIKDNEAKQNSAFEKWISNQVTFSGLKKEARQCLCDYVAGLHREIGDLQAEVIGRKPDGSLISPEPFSNN